MIDDQLISAYLAELKALRTHGADFAKSYPDIAARLDIGPRRSRDPQVERLVESSAFLAARLRVMIEGCAAELPSTLLSLLAPILLDPVPSMTLLRFGDGMEVQRIPRGARFDHWSSSRAVTSFTTTMALTAAPLRLRVRRFRPPARFADGLSLRLTGTATDPLVLCLGNDDLSAAALLDAITSDLSVLEVVPPGGGAPRSVPLRSLRLLGFDPSHAALPQRRASHAAHRILTEMLVFPEKFRFVQLSGVDLPSGSELRLWFSRHLRLPPVLAPDVISVNCVPAVNLWPAVATPFDVTGRELEYPVRVDAQRHRFVECHSVESVEMYGSQGGTAVRIDPLIAFGDVDQTAVRWGVRRSLAGADSQVLMFFKGLDYQSLGKHRFLASPKVLASNGDLPRKLRVGTRVHPVQALGDWRAFVHLVPTPYRPPLVDSSVMRQALGYLQASLHGLAAERSSRGLRVFLKLFPGGADARWIDVIGRVALRSTVSLRDGFAQPGVTVFIAFDDSQAPATSRTLVERVLKLVLDSQRGLNAIEEVVIVAS